MDYYYCFFFPSNTPFSLFSFSLSFFLKVLGIELRASRLLADAVALEATVCPGQPGDRSYLCFPA
jgi:hypothetical protein